eukprot:TRINITY_DN9684_c0_g1_i1.p1 TRINITY_DN9684_c0_g1~~TRINITY_DN9684_c0_g1_i1.p1  ORF type:complete len:316 (+),score=64.11 TRINITY_DN9684_c0_g1_i1:45-950(+)
MKNAVDKLYIYPNWIMTLPVAPQRKVFPYPVKEMVREGLWPKVDSLYICHNCFQPLAERAKYASHMKKCDMPKGKMVYSDVTANIQVYELSGHGDMAMYATKFACLLACFVPDKQVLYSLDSFLLYTVYQVRGEKGISKLVGGFSAQPVSPKWENTCSAISVFTVLPPYRRSGYGTFIIELSRALAKARECGAVTAERPLSSLGRLSHGKVWLKECYAALEKLLKEGSTPSLTDIAKEASLTNEDVISALSSVGALRPCSTGLEILVPKDATAFKGTSFFNPNKVFAEPVIGIRQKYHRRS